MASENQNVMADTMACTTVSFVLSSYFWGKSLGDPRKCFMRDVTSQN